jgi:NTE family protein
VALVLQGGGALGAYQAGVYQGLAEAGLHPDRVAGISIGAINAALIVGNSPETRVAKLREFWELITANPAWAGAFQPAVIRGDLARGVFSRLAAANVFFNGVPAFFSPRQPSPWWQPPGTAEAISFYDTSALRATLERLVDFDRINAAREMQFSVGAVNVRTGNFAYFDAGTHCIGPQHIMASGALPPGFAPVEIDGEHYWDGGLVSNTPLEWVVEKHHGDMLIFQVDLWNAQGEYPATINDVLSREKDIRYSSRTRAATAAIRRHRRLRSAFACLLDRLPEEFKTGPEVRLLEGAADLSVYNIIQLIHRAKSYERASKDFEFSRLAMEEHWNAGYNDTIRTLRHPEVLQRPSALDGVFTFDLAVNGRE